MAILTSEYQYIGRSNAVNSPNGSAYYLLLYAKTSANIHTGAHTVSVRMRMACTSGSSYYNWKSSGWAKVDDKSAIGWDTEDVPGSPWNANLTEDGVTYKQWTDLREGSVEIGAGYGKEKTVNISASYVVRWGDADFLPTPGVYATASIAAVLPAIQGASVIAYASDTELGQQCAVKWTPYSSSLYYLLTCSVGSWSSAIGPLCPGQTAEYTQQVDIPLEQTLAEQITEDPPRAEMTVTLVTYADSQGSTQLGQPSTAVCTVTVPQNDATRPSVDITAAPSGSKVEGLYVQGKTKVTVEFDDSCRLGAKIRSKQFSVEGKTYSEGETSGFLTESGQVTVTGTVTDSRGFTGTDEATIYVHPYGKPRVTGIVCERCNENNEPDSAGTWLHIGATREYYPLDAEGAQNNFCTLRYRVDGGDWITLIDGTDPATDSVDIYRAGGLVLLPTETYYVEFSAVDTLGEESVPVTIIVPTDEVEFHLREGGKGAAFGKYAEEEELLDVDWDGRFRKGLQVDQGLNGVYLQTHYVSGTPTMQIQTKYTDFSGTGDNRQSIFLFGTVNFTPVHGLLQVNNGGSVSWSGTGSVTATALEEGRVEMTLPTWAWDWFTAISAEEFTFI